MPTARVGNNAWIISPTWDLLFLLATPALIFPALWLLTRAAVTPEQLAVAVLAFASFGHHLPGFLRAYGDRELFARFRWRFLLAPPVICAVAAWFAWQQLHGFTLILFFWATWHILMQTYGLLRIYDAKRGIHGPWATWTDYLACVAIFAAGVVFSEARVYGLAELMWLSGLPVFGPETLAAARWATGVGAGMLTLVYVANALRQQRSKQGVAWQKLVLLTSTGALYWASGLVSTNVLVGVAMFEIFHAVQYFAIVWIYNRQVVGKSADRMPKLALLFHGGLGSVALYGGSILLFGASFFALRSIDSMAVQRAATVLFVTSACLHFYYDGFIWRISRQETRSDLQLDSEASSDAAGSTRPARVPAITAHHGLKWCALAVIALVLVGLEQRRGSPTDAEQSRMLDELAAIAPNLPELQSRLAAAALARGDTQQAVRMARKAVKMRPQSHVAQGDLGKALRQAGRFDEAKHALRRATELAPHDWSNHFNLAETLRQAEDWNAAEDAYAAAARLAPESGQVQKQWAVMYRDRRDFDSAVVHFNQALSYDADLEQARQGLIRSLSDSSQHVEAVAAGNQGIQRSPHSADAQRDLGEALVAAERFTEALPPLERAVELDDASADAHYLLGVALMQTGDPLRAGAEFRTAVARDPRHKFAHLQLGSLAYLAGKLETALWRYRRCLEIDPQFSSACNNLGAVLASQERWPEAAEAYRQAIAIDPRDAAANYNLGLLLLGEGDLAQAAVYLRRAGELGQTLDPAVVAELDLRDE